VPPTVAQILISHALVHGKKRPQRDDIKIYLLFRELSKAHQGGLLSSRKHFQSHFSLELTQSCRWDDPLMRDGARRIPPRIGTYLNFLRQF